MNDERREILLDACWRVPLASGLLAATWSLFANTAGDSDGAAARFAGLGLIVMAAVIIAPVVAAVLADPVGSLFYPRRSTPQPGYSGAEGRRRRGRHEEALAEYASL